MKHFSAILLIFLLLTSFQCQRWAKYADSIDAKVEPDTVMLVNDTISFALTVRYDAERFKNENTTLITYVMGHSQIEELLQIELTNGLTTKSIKQKLNLKKPIKSIGVKFKNGDRPSIESPVFAIAVVEDRR